MAKPATSQHVQKAEGQVVFHHKVLGKQNTEHASCNGGVELLQTFLKEQTQERHETSLFSQCHLCGNRV